MNVKNISFCSFTPPPPQSQKDSTLKDSATLFILHKKNIFARAGQNEKLILQFLIKLNMK